MYDIIILGSGPAGLTAAIYCARANKKTLIIAGDTLGGQTAEIANLENSIKIIDLRAVRMSEVRQNTMQNLLPKTKFYFSPYCNCKL